ncbi:MAG TPA: hypothetical protein VGC32_02520 [Solirubrobacterales bacterium]
MVFLSVLLALAGVAAAKPSHHAKGTGSRRHHRKGGKGAGALNPGKPIAIGVGFRPQVLVDEAGVAHITYATQSAEHGPAGEHTYTAGWDNYCRLPRGSAKCAVHARFDAPIVYPAKGPEGLPSPFFENSPGANQDIGEGSVPLATGNQLAILAHRPLNVVAVPGGTSKDVNFLWTSDDGGKKFTGPGLTSTMDYYGGAVTYGNPSSIGIFGTTGELLEEEKTLGHVFFQEVPAGAYAPAAARVELGRGANDLLARRQIAVDGDRPVVAWDNLKDVIVREYKGKGDIDDAANWTTSKFPGVDPSLASGPHGTWLTYYPPGGVRKGVVVKLVDGHRSGPTSPVFPSLFDGTEDQLAEAADGELVAGWVAKGSDEQNYRRAMLSTSTDGRHWTSPQLLDQVGRHDQISGLEIAVGPDGGGVAVFVHGGLPGEKVNVGTLFGIGGLVTAVPFGPRGSTGKKGLGTTGSGQSGCLDIRFGAVHAHVDSGCFLQLVDKAHPSGDASIAYGGVHVNGLEVQPDSPGTGIVIDDSAHTIESTGGNASILLEGPGTPPIKLWDGPLKAALGKNDNVGDPLFSMPMTTFHANVLGFEALGTPVAVLGTESASIPLSLKMPSYLGGTGSATLTANMAEGLQRPSLHISIPDITLNGVALRGASIDWAGPEDQWTGSGELEMPPGAGAAGLDVHGAQIAFDHGDFSFGHFTTAAYPGTPIHANAYLENLEAGFDLHPPPSLTGNAEIGAVAHGDGVYSLEATGPLRTTFGDPSTMSVEGEGAIYGVPLNSAHATFTTAGTFHETGVLGLDEGGLTIGGTLDATTDLATGTTSGTIAGGFSFLDQGIEESIPFNDSGFGYCEEVLTASVGFLFKWSGGVELFTHGCEEALASSGTPG